MQQPSGIPKKEREMHSVYGHRGAHIAQEWVYISQSDCRTLYDVEKKVKRNNGPKWPIALAPTRRAHIHNILTFSMSDGRAQFQERNNTSDDIISIDPSQGRQLCPERERGGLNGPDARAASG